MAAAHEAALAVTAEEGSWLPLLPINAYGEWRPDFACTVPLTNDFICVLPQHWEWDPDPISTASTPLPNACYASGMKAIEIGQGQCTL